MEDVMNRYKKPDGHVQIGPYSYPVSISGESMELSGEFDSISYLRKHGNSFHLNPGDKIHVSWSSGEMHIQVQHTSGGTALYNAKIQKRIVHEPHLKHNRDHKGRK
jgi:hypothetical protein